MKPALLLYCQHSLGLGHFVRSLALAEAFAKHFRVVFFNGGPVPAAMNLPDSICFENLPPIRMLDDGSISGDGNAEDILSQRRDRMLAVAREVDAKMLVVELYPFGRKKFAVELDPLIEAVRSGGGQVVCSVRDILVTGREDQMRHDNRAANILNRSFDRVLVHTDPKLFALADSFQPSTPVSIPVDHTGYVLRAATVGVACTDSGATLVAAGGGAVGHAVFHAAIAAQPRLFAEKGWAMTLVAGPLFPEPDWLQLVEASRSVKGLTLVRAVPTMAPLLSSAGRFVGQCGYNSALEVCQSGLPALFIPFARGQESEQTARAVKLRSLGFADWIAEDGLSGPLLFERLAQLGTPSETARLDLDGARKSAAILEEMARCFA